MSNKNLRPILCMLIILLLILLTAVTGCSSSADPEKSSSVPPDTEAATEAAIETGMIVPTDSSLYYYDGLLYYLKPRNGAAPTRIYYIDPETGESGILCGKPDCTHDSYDCNACINSYGRGITIYQDKIYWYTGSLGGRKLMCEDIDGTNRREVMALDKEHEWFVNDKSFIGIYNDVLYRCGDGNTVTDGEPSYNMLLYCQPLQKGSEPKDLYSAQNVYSVAARMYGNQLYFAVVGIDYDLNICVCDLDSGEVKELFYKEKADNTPFDIAISDNKLILHGFGPCISIYSLEDGSYTVIGGEEHFYYAATGSMIYEPISQDEYRLYTINEDFVFEGKENPEGFTEDTYYSYYLGSLEETMLFLWEASTDSETMPGQMVNHYYIAALSTETLEWKILWDGISDYE